MVRRLHERRRGNITRRSYVQPTLEAIRSYEYPEMQLYCHEDAATGVGADPLPVGVWLQLAAVRLRLAGRPEAVGTDGLLDVCTFRTRFAASRRLVLVARDAEQSLPAGRRRAEPQPNAADGGGRRRTSVPFQMDGDFGGTLPVDVDVLPGELRLLVMPDVAQRLGFVRRASSLNFECRPGRRPRDVEQSRSNRTAIAAARTNRCW